MWYLNITGKELPRQIEPCWATVSRGFQWQVVLWLFGCCGVQTSEAGHCAYVTALKIIGVGEISPAKMVEMEQGASCLGIAAIHYLYTSMASHYVPNFRSYMYQIVGIPFSFGTTPWDVQSGRCCHDESVPGGVPHCYRPAGDPSRTMAACSDFLHDRLVKFHRFIIIYWFWSKYQRDGVLQMQSWFVQTEGIYWKQGETYTHGLVRNQGAPKSSC